MASPKEHLTDGGIWLRGLFMLLFLIAYNITEIIILALAVFQFIYALLTGTVNERVLQFGKSASRYVNEVFDFLTFNTEERPFPFAPWPDVEAGGEFWLDDFDDLDDDDPPQVNHGGAEPGKSADSGETGDSKD